MSKRNKRQRRTPKPKPKGSRAPGHPDDFVPLPFGYMARFGRFIQMRHLATEEEHQSLQEAMLAEAEEARGEQEKRRSRLLEILSEADSTDLVARASLTYLHVDPDTFKEWEDDRSPAHIEYLALQALASGLGPTKEVDPLRASELTSEAIQLIRAMFRSAQMLIVADGIAASRDRPGDPTVEYAVRTRLESVGVRGTGYAEHVERVIHGCLDPFDSECADLLGFTATDALAIIRASGHLISTRINPRLKEAAASRAQMIRALKRQRRKGQRDGSFPKWLLELPPREAAVQLGWMGIIWLFADSRSLALLTADALSKECGIKPSTCESVLRAFSCGPELFRAEHHSFPGGPHPLIVRPILPITDGYLLPVPSLMMDAVRPRMEDLLQQVPSVWDRYVTIRGQYVEAEATSLIAAALPGAGSWTGILWSSASDSGDLDGLVVADDFSIRVQCKAGRLTAPARRGAPQRMRSDIGKLIEEGSEQHARLEVALAETSAEAIGFSNDRARALRAPIQVEAIVCLDDVTVWATETHRLRRLGALPDERDVPWVLSLMDLMVVVDLLEGAQLVHYLLRRQRLERDGRVSAHDEMDWVGHYISEGLYFDHYFEGAESPSLFRLLSYQEPIDAWYFTRAGLRNIPAPKPSQDMPKRLGALVGRLQRERPQHWILGAIALLNGNQESRKLWDAAVGRVGQRLRTVGWSNASQIFDGRLGVTFYVDHRVGSPDIRAAVADYCQAKLHETGQPNWVAIGEGRTGDLFVLVLQADETFPLVDVFLQPPPVSGSLLAEMPEPTQTTD